MQGYQAGAVNFTHSLTLATGGIRAEETADDQCHSADANGCIGYIKGWPGVSSEPDLYVIDDMPKVNTVN